MSAGTRGGSSFVTSRTYPHAGHGAHLVRVALSRSWQDGHGTLQVSVRARLFGAPTAMIECPQEAVSAVMVKVP